MAGANNVDACYINAPCPTVTGNTNCDPHATTCAYTNDAVLNGKIYAEDATGPDMPRCSLTFTCAAGYTKTTVSAPTLPATSQGVNDLQYKSHNGQNDSNNDNDLSAGE